MSYFLDNPIPTGAQVMRGYANGGAVGVSAPVDLDFAIPGGSDKPLMQQLYEQGLVSEDEYMSWLAESSGQPAPGPDIFVEGADVPESTGIDYDAMARAFGMLGDTGKLEPIAYGRGFSLGNLEGGLPITESRNVRATPAVEQTLADLGISEEEANAIAAQYNASKAAVSPLAQLSMADVAKQAGVSEADLAASQEQIGKVYGARQDTLQQISDRLQKNDFKGAFDIAVAAEDAGEGQFFENIVNPELMRYMRGPMTKDEIKQFYEAIPQDEYIKRYGEGNMFILQKGIDESLAALGDDEVGFVDPRAALIARPDPTVGIVGDLVAAALAATGIGIPAAMAVSGAQKYITSGGNLKAALTSAALTGVGMKVGEAVKAGLSPGIDQLTGVTVQPSLTGVATTASKAAIAAGEAAANAVASGVAPSALAEIVVTAARQAAPSLAQGVIGSVTGSVLNQLAAEGVKVPEQQLQQAQQATQRSPLEQAEVTASAPPDLEEIVVQSLRKGAPVDINTLLASTGAQGVQDILSERQIQEQQELEQREAQQEQEPEQQPEQQQEPDDFAGTFKISTEALPKLDLYAGAWPALSQQLASAGYKKPLIDEQVTPDDIEELVIRASKPTELDLFAGVPNFISNVPEVIDTRAPAEYYPELEQVTVEAQRPAEVDLSLNVPDLSSQVDFYDKPAFADTPLDEVVVKTKRPTELDLIAPPFDIPKTTTPPEVDVPEAPLDEVVVEGKRPEDVDLIAPPITIPTQTPVDLPEPKINEPSQWEKLLDKYGTLENLLKVAGLVSGLGGTGGAGTGTGGAGGAGYDPRRGAGAGPWIDWEKVKAEADAAGMNLNTYTARNWNKIQNRALEAGMAQPSVASYNTPEPTSPGFDLMAYLENYQPEQKAIGGMAKGSRVRGPGSGREDLIPALLSDGEYVIDAETMALLGDGSVEKAADMMDDFRQNIRKHKGAALAKGGISPDAKSPLQYLRSK